jgi:hypothetical protein
MKILAGSKRQRYDFVSEVQKAEETKKMLNRQQIQSLGVHQENECKVISTFQIIAPNYIH